jgi:hypothetical protein
VLRLSWRAALHCPAIVVYLSTFKLMSAISQFCLVLLYCSLTCVIAAPPPARSPVVHPPLRIIGGQLYDFSPAIRAHAAGAPTPFFISAVADSMTAEGLLARQSDGFEILPPPQSALLGGPSDLLQEIFAQRILDRGNVSAGQFLALSPEMRATLLQRIGPAKYKYVLIRDLTNGIPLGRELKIFVLPARPIENLPIYWYGRPATNTTGFTNIYMVGPQQISSRPLRASPPSRKTLSEDIGSSH